MADQPCKACGDVHVSTEPCIDQPRSVDEWATYLDPGHYHCEDTYYCCPECPIEEGHVGGDTGCYCSHDEKMKRIRHALLAVEKAAEERGRREEKIRWIVRDACDAVRAAAIHTKRDDDGG